MEPRAGTSKGPSQGRLPAKSPSQGYVATVKGPFKGYDSEEKGPSQDHDAGSKGPSQDHGIGKSPFQGSGVVLDSSEVRSSPASPMSSGDIVFSPLDVQYSPKGMIERDILTLARLSQVGALSDGMLRWMALFTRMQEAELDGTSLSEEDKEMLLDAMKNKVSASTKRRRIESSPEEEGSKRVRSHSATPPFTDAERQAAAVRCTTSPQTSQDQNKKAPRTLASQMPSEKRQEKPKTETAPPAKKPSFAQMAQKTVTVPKPTVKTQAPPTNAAKHATRTEVASGKERAIDRSEPRYPPLIVERIGNWTLHFKEIASKLGRPPNGRPFGQGIRFNPSDEKEYRVVQAYLSELEKRENISWFSYSLPQERSLKVAIRGLPVDTNIDEITEALEQKGFAPEYIKCIKGRHGRPGCVFYAQLKRTPGLTPAIYETTELLLMPGITIEAWRAKKGPAQCHRCQKFRHSSHNCHREQACVRCGERHAAKECPRPLDEPATCANCGGTHPANYAACPVFRKEIRNKRAGTWAETIEPRGRKGQAPVTQVEVAETAPTTLMAPANGPKETGFQKQKQRKKKAKTTEKPAKAQAKIPQTQDAQPARRESLGQTIGVLKEILEAVQSGTLKPQH